MTQKTQPIGIFDSGIGGLTVANAIIGHLPNEQVVYFGDTKHLPYGDKSGDAIRYYALRITRMLEQRGCKLIVVACNSASSAAYDVMVDFFQGEILLVNVVDPLVEEIGRRKYKNVGLIATRATIASRVYQNKLEHQHIDHLFAKATPLLAPMIEDGFYEGNIAAAIVETYLSDKGFQDIEALILACTHYPLIKDKIREVLPEQVDIIDSTDLMGHQVEHLLQQRGLLNEERNPKHTFLVSDLTESFSKTTKIFFGKEVELEACDIWVPKPPLQNND